MKFSKSKNTKSENENSNPNHDDHENTKSNSKIKSWLTGKVGSFLLLSGVGFALYKIGILGKITSYFKKDKGKEVNHATHTFSNPNEKSEQSTSNSNSPS